MDSMTTWTSASYPSINTTSTTITNNTTTSTSKQTPDEALFLQSLSPEFIAQQERLMKNIQIRNSRLASASASSGNRRVGKDNKLRAQPLAIRTAIYC